MAGESKGNSIETIQIELSKKYVAPKIVKDKQKGYVLNGKFNSYFDYVNERRLGSPTNSSIISNYIKLIYGQGLYDRANNLITQWISKHDTKKIVDDYYSQGMAYLEVIRKGSGELARLKHLPLNWLAPSIKNDNNEIEGYFFCKEWDKVNFKKPDYIPAFGFGNGYENEILCVRDHQFGQDYFALPKYQAVLQYAELEEEISNYSLSHIKKGLAFGYIINIPNSSNLTDEQKRQVKRQILKALQGSDNAGATVFNFMTGDGDVINVEVIQQNASHKQWEALRDQAREQIIVGHEVVSPLLFGINRGSGLSSTAEEMDEAESQTMTRVIKPLQQIITDTLQDLFLSFGIYTDLYFMSLSASKEVELSKEYSDDDIANELINVGESFNDDEWELIQKTDVDYDHEDDIITKIRKLNGDKLASTGTARPNANSEQDSDNVKIRYRYTGNKTSENSRRFCQLMTQADKVYRKEDIIQMGSKAVNAGFGPRGADTYSIWLYKGGKNCYHKWQREIYLRKDANVDVRSPLAEIISTSEARRRGYKVPTNDSKVSIKPINMPNKGGLTPR